MKGLLVLFLSMGIIALLYLAMTGDLFSAGIEAMQSTSSAGSIVP
ncbi:hypothetical protein [Anaerovorax sp. IOR16]|nr:hypothetical protein [Anaerovorax sp. IOR16]